MALQIYDRFFAYFGGQLLGEATSVTVKFDGAPIPAPTMVKDLGGFTIVPKLCTISVKTFVPSAGFEVDVIKKFLKNEIVDVRVQSGGSGKQIDTKGMVNPPTLTSGTGATDLDFEVVCEAKAFE